MSKKLSKELEKLLEECAGYSGLGTSDKIWHQGYLKLDNPTSEPWVTALDAIYNSKGKDTTLLRALIKAGTKPPTEMLPHIDELFEKMKFGNRHAGRPATPSYMESPAEYWMNTLTKNVRDLVERDGITVEAAIDIVGGDDRDKLANAYYGKRGSRQKKRS